MAAPRFVVLALLIGCTSVPSARAGGDLASAAPVLSPVAVTLGFLAAAGAIVAIVLALQARRLAVHAVQEAGQARARAVQGQAGGGGVSTESLAGVEKLWAAKLAAIEVRLPSGAARTPASREAERPSEGIAARIEELERVVADLAVTMKESRRPAPAASGLAAASRESAEIAWPVCLSADTSAMNDVRQTIVQALKSRDPSARDLLDRLRVTEQWAGKKPGAGDVAIALAEISTLLIAALRRGAAVAPLDGSLLSDRVLAALRPSWKPWRPQLDCRSFYPGATFDPDWMEDRSHTGLQRPVISEMLSWAVFEKLDSGRRILAKAGVTAE